MILCCIAFSAYRVSIYRPAYGKFGDATAVGFRERSIDSTSRKPAFLLFLL